MFKIINIDKQHMELAKKFLMAVPTIKEVDEGILANATLVMDDQNIVGSISYEEFNDAGLIRYFVFKKILSESLIKELFKELEASAKNNDINKLFCVVDDKNIESLFTSLEFEYLDKTKVYIDEEAFEQFEFGASNVMLKLL